MKLVLLLDGFEEAVGFDDLKEEGDTRHEFIP